jgi:hypothetical protein
MHSLYIWPDNPALSLLVLFLVSQVIFYAARVPVHRGLRKAGVALGGAFRLVARWLRNAAEQLRARNREVLLEAGRAEAEAKLEREFTRLATTFTTELKEYPALHKRLDENVRRVDEDLKASAVTPPEAPGWPEAVQAVAALEKAGDRTVQKVLDEIHRSAVAGEKKALAEWRDAMAKRHKVLAQIAPVWKAILGILEQVKRAVTGTLESASKIDAYMDRYEKIRRGEDAAERGLAGSALNLFLISLLVVLVAGAGGLVNFQLISRPMSELVTSGAYVAGMPVSMIAALVIVLMEVVAGVFVMETLGITHLFPRLSGLPASRRRIIFLVALLGLLLLSAVEASLAILREQLVESEQALRQALAGTAAPGKAQVAAPFLSNIPTIGQAVLGFILPWILAMIAVPLEMLVESGRHVVGRGLVLLVQGLGVLFRICAHLFRYLAAVLTHVFDIYIVLPLQVERLVVRGRGGDAGPGPREPGALRNPTERTQTFKAPR